MNRLLLISLGMLALSGCASRTPQSYTPQVEAEAVHTLTLLSPQGAGSIRLVRISMRTGAVVTNRYKIDGAITTTDRLGEWKFGYTQLTLNDTIGVASDLWIFGIQGLGFSLKNTSPAMLELDWTRSVFVDASGRARPVIHKGVRFNDRAAATAPSLIPPNSTLDDFVFPSDGITLDRTWVSPAVFERMEPGTNMSVTLNIKAGDKVVLQTFRFVAQ